MSNRSLFLLLLMASLLLLGTVLLLPVKTSLAVVTRPAPASISHPTAGTMVPSPLSPGNRMLAATESELLPPPSLPAPAVAPLPGFEIAPGVQAPLALLDNGLTNLTKEQKSALAKIATEFSVQVDGVLAQTSDVNIVSQAWETARVKADEKYRLIFGQENYLKQQAAAARQAITPAE